MRTLSPPHGPGCSFCESERQHKRLIWAHAARDLLLAVLLTLAVIGAWWAAALLVLGSWP